jgi:hypothetical protein
MAERGGMDVMRWCQMTYTMLAEDRRGEEGHGEQGME